MPKFNEIGQSIIENVEKVIIGKRPQILSVLSAILARGHVLLEDVPGVAKTMLARSFATSFGCIFKRVQCTPDLLPTDVTGVSIFNQKNMEFEFMKGPLFTNVLLADEINRATPRTQSALLEAMEEKQVSVDGATYRLAPPFVVIATQNPVEQEGTFPLPEAQLDRFLVRVFHWLSGVSSKSPKCSTVSMEAILLTRSSRWSTPHIIQQMQQYVAAVFVHQQIKEYILRIVHATRNGVKLGLGGSPRASIALYRTAQALAALEGRTLCHPRRRKETRRSRPGPPPHSQARIPPAQGDHRVGGRRHHQNC